MVGKRLSFCLLALLLGSSLVGTWCGQQPAELVYINLNLGTEPPTVDPCLARDTTSAQVIELLFLGLTDRADETQEVVPELAVGWETSDDGLRWTFHMRRDVYWIQYHPATGQVEKKRPVTAHDVEYAIKRALDPRTGSTSAYTLYIIEGAEEFHSRSAIRPGDSEAVGVRAIDDYTIEFEVTNPAAYLPGLMSTEIAYPVPRETIEGHGARWTELENIWTNGHYMLETWNHETKMVMAKNPVHPEATGVQIEQINWFMVTENDVAMAMYENGDLDVVGPPIEDMDRIKTDPVLSQELTIAPVPCTYYYGFNTTKPPVDDPHVRRALSYAVDRQALCKTVLKGGQVPARTLTYPDVWDSPAQDPNFQGIVFDPEKARRELELAGYPGGSGFPQITLLFNTSEGHQQIAQFIQANWKEHLGIDVALFDREWRAYLEMLDEDPPQIFRLGWCGGSDAHDWVMEFHGTRGANAIRWSNAEFDRVIDQAAFETDLARRKDLYLEAEKILCVDEAGILPVYHYTRVVLTKSYVTRTFALWSAEHVNTWQVNRPQDLTE